ncbi:uncharacterized protein METZ01_LOCUS308796 [marine metagenome]|uniref:Uncharacterized protein n=1 Tax=marine metagenome TaxID=408172 RepID=A0A382N843_9ZZZZ
MFDKNKYKSTIGFTDMLFNILLGFAFLFIVAFLLIKPEAKKEDFERRAEFVVVMEWDNDASGDIDLYVEDPTNKQVSFRYHNHNYMHLDKDDLGAMNDTVVNADGTISTVKINREVVTIRGIIKGEYVVNGHYYSLRSYDKVNPPKPNITVRVELHKVNPYSIMWVGEKEFNHRGQEETFLRFRLDKDGNILPPFTFEKKKFVTPMQALGNYTAPPTGAAAYEDGDPAR